MFTSLINQFRSSKANEVHIKVDSWQCNGCINKNSKLFAAIGSRKSFKDYSHHLYRVNETNSSDNHVWNFTYKNAECSSFVVALFEQIDNKEPIPIGELEIKVGAFKINAVTKHTFTLRPFDRNIEPSTIKLLVHVCENGAKHFDAPVSYNIKDDYEVIRNNSKIFRQA